MCRRHRLNMLRLRTSLRVMSGMIATRLILHANTRHLTIKRLSTTLREAGATLTKVDAPNRNALNRNALSLRTTKSHAARNRAMRNRARPATSRSPERTVLVDRPVGRI